jgi:hypothetical protein
MDVAMGIVVQASADAQGLYRAHESIVSFIRSTTVGFVFAYYAVLVVCVIFIIGGRRHIHPTRMDSGD